MKPFIKKLSAAVCTAALLTTFASCGEKTAEDPKVTYPDATVISLHGDSASVNDSAVVEYDYVWHCDPTSVHSEEKDAPAVYHTGSLPVTDHDVYIDGDLKYYPALDTDKFKLVDYDGEKEWAYYYEDGVNNDYIFATLPGKTEPNADMMHTEEEASQNKVLHITKAGKYILEGEWNGQILIDIPDPAESETFYNKDSKVTLILNNATIKCTVAPAITFDNVYECDCLWEETDSHSADVDTANAGAVIVLADNSKNVVSGENVYRMLKTKYKNEDSTDEIKVQKKYYKRDGALYSCMSMNIEGGSLSNGTLEVNSNFEGIDSELHLAFNGGVITVNSGDDGINVNEDHVSTVIFGGAEVTVNPAKGDEGDGIDSNGYIVINEGKVSVNGVRSPDYALDSDDGIYYNGGEVIIDGETQSYEKGSTFRDSGQSTKGKEHFSPNGQNGNPPEIPNGEAPNGQNGTPPEMPNGEAPNGAPSTPPQNTK